MSKTRSLIRIAGCMFMLTSIGLASCGNNTSSSTDDPTTGEEGSSITEPVENDSTSSDDVTSSEEPVESDSTDSSASSTVDNSVYTYNIKVGTVEGREDFTNERVSSFLSQYGYTNVTYETVSVNENRVDTEVTDWETGPDVYPYAGERLVSLIANDAVSEIPETCVSDIGNYNSTSSIEGSTIDSSTYGYPYSISSGYFLFYNKAIVEEKDTASLESLLTALSEDGMRLLYQGGEPWYTMSALSAFGAGYKVSLNENRNAIGSITADFDSDNGFLGAKALKYMIDSDTVVTGTEDSLSFIAPTVSNGYGAVITGAWYYDSFVSQVGEDNLGACKLPSITVDGTTSNLSSFTSYRYYGVNPNTSKDDEARLDICHKLAMYMAGEESQKTLFEDHSLTPTDKRVIETDAVKSDICAYALASQSEYSLPQSVVPDNIWSAPYDLYDALKTGSISTDDEIKTYLVSFNEEIEKTA